MLIFRIPMYLLRCVCTAHSPNSQFAVAGYSLWPPSMLFVISLHQFWNKQHLQTLQKNPREIV